MPVISFGEESNQIWGGAGWALRQVIEDLRPYAQGNAAFLAALEHAGHIGYLGVEHLDSSLRRVVIAAIQDMCIGIVNGARPSTINKTMPGDQMTRDQYHEGIKDLLSMAEAAAHHLQL
jgi:hypothetical protein